MKPKMLYALVVFIAVLAIHFAYSWWASTQVQSLWVQPDDAVWPASYISNQDYMIGIAYALAGAFTVYSFMKLSEKSKKGAVGTLGGLTLTGFLYFGVCFFTGCCGSPMLAVYLSVLGPSFLGFTKPLILAITILSIAISFVWMERKAKSPCACCAGGECNSN